MKPKAKGALNASILILVLVALIIGATFLGIYLHDSNREDFRVLAYFTPRSDYVEEDIEKYDFSKITHLIYAFANVRSDTLELYIKDEEIFAYLVRHLKENYPNVKIMLSVGSSMENDGYCSIASTVEGRDSFVRQCSAIIEGYGIDGIDIDWEYPGYSMFDRKVCSNCVSDHASLIEALREGLPDGAVLSYAGCGNALGWYDHKRLSKVVDFVNVMLYDFSLENNSPFDSAKKAIYNYQLKGYRKDQLNWGVPFYGRCAVEEYDYRTYAQIMDLADMGELQIVQEKNRSYAYYKGNLLSFDSREQILKKSKYVKKRGYGGVFCWNMTYDRDGELMSLIWNELKG